jgi:hypothetical protein
MTPLEVRAGELRGSVRSLGYPVREREQDGTPQ